MSVFDFALIAFIVAAAAILLYRSLRKQWTCSGCTGCSCSRGKQAAKTEGFGKDIQHR
ncbi:MAG: FeoB-associated Cys-rich membrane protein [Deltaproteobacteria bacterium]|nr:FeoB-associated Cys-rich membrane protein [Deltaproteobacteria bacterium]